MVTSLFSRLQKLNKEATPPEWRQFGWNVVHSETGRLTGTPEKEEDAALIVECRNSLPAVLNLIEAARDWKEINDKSEERGVSQDTGTFIAWQDFCEALAVFMDESW
jgi:hypothetical protein